MLRRKAILELNKWKTSPNRKSLVVQGARQVGKTFAIREFGRQNYKTVLEINFKETPSAKEIFSSDLDVNTLIMGIRFRYPTTDITPGDTLIFLDEIQECPEAITALKFWTDDGRFDVIASGSLLGIDYHRPSSYPVGYVEYLQMYGLDFEEFLWACDISEDMILSLNSYFTDVKPVPSAVHERMTELLREYTAVGGMPEVVAAYMETRDYNVVDKIQRQLLQGYQYDIAHYADANEKVKAEKCYLSIAKQLLDKENHKFQYKEVEYGGRAQKYHSSIEWLVRADIVRLSRVVTDVRFDLDDYARDDFFRAYTCDLSLLIAMKDYALKQHIVENTLGGNTKGGIYECAIADIMIKKGYSLYFYKNETTKREIDILIQKNGSIIPLEIKSGNTKATSLIKLTESNTDIVRAYKLIDGNVGTEDGRIITIPLYMAMFV